MIRLLLICAYPLALLARLVQALGRRDPLRLSEPKGTCWIERTESPATASYFSEASAAEGRGHGGAGALIGWFMLLIARLSTPRRIQPGEKYSAGADREKGIPDEVYTLW